MTEHEIETNAHLRNLIKERDEKIAHLEAILQSIRELAAAFREHEKYEFLAREIDQRLEDYA